MSRPKQVRSVSAGGVVLNPEGDVLVVRQSNSSWSLPKGHLNPGEELEAAARREIYEESGLSDLLLVRRLGQYQRYRHGVEKEELKNIVMFLFRTESRSICPVDPDNPEARWMAKERVAECLTYEADRQFFESIRATLLYD